MNSDLHSTSINDTTKDARTSQVSGDRRVLPYDALRVVAMGAVIAIHALMTARSLVMAPSWLTILDRELHFAVPLLTFLSGVLVWGRPWTSGAGRYRQFVSKKMRRVIMPYLVWFALYGTLLFFGAPFSGALRATATDRTFVDLFGYLFSGHVWYHLYFIPMIATFWLLTPLASNICTRFRWGSEALVLVTLGVKVYAWPPLAIWLTAHASPYITSYATHIFVHLPHMALGAWFGVRLASWLKSRQSDLNSGLEFSQPMPWCVLNNLVVPAAFFILVGGNKWSSAFHYPLIIGGLMCIAIAGMPIWSKLRRPLGFTSDLAFGAYFIHPLFLLSAQLQVKPVSGSWLYTSPFGVPLLWMGLILLSFGGSYLLSLSPKTAWLIGE